MLARARSVETAEEVEEEELEEEELEEEEVEKEEEQLTPKKRFEIQSLREREARRKRVSQR